jgi:hypothetical protein
MVEKVEKLESPYIPAKAKFIFENSKEKSNKVLNFKQIFI